MGASMTTTAADALSAEWLARPQAIEAYYAGLRDKFDPKKPLWITETATPRAAVIRGHQPFLIRFDT